MAYPYKISFTVQELIPNQQGEVITAELTNPFANYSNLLRHLKWIATDAPIDQLREFADCGNQSLTDWGSNYSRYHTEQLKLKNY